MNLPKYKIGDIVIIKGQFLDNIPAFVQVKITAASYDEKEEIWFYRAYTEYFQTIFKNVSEKNIISIIE